MLLKRRGHQLNDPHVSYQLSELSYSISVISLVDDAVIGNCYNGFILNYTLRLSGTKYKVDKIQGSQKFSIANINYNFF